MLKKLIRLVKYPYFIITVVYSLTNIFLLLLSGCWWDDWTFMSHDLVYVNEVATQSGRPEWNLLIPLCWSLVNNGRLLIFVLFYIDALLIYNILNDSFLFSKKDSLVIALLFIVLPVNDARLLISNFPYDVGLFLFYLALFIFMRMFKMNIKNVFFRLFNVFLFLISFILTSLLSYYYLIFIYLIYANFKNSKEKTIIRKLLFSIKDAIFKYLDYFILPFVYIILNKLLFTTTGDFSARSSISLEGIIKTFKYIPLSIVNIYRSIVENMFSVISYLPVLVIIVIACFVLYKKQDKVINDDKKKSIIFIVVGFVVLYLGLFVYAVIRKNVISCTGVKGRDSVLTPLGISISLYYLFSLFGYRAKKCLCFIFVLLGLLSTNLLYIEWQKDYYYQLCMENLFKDPIIENNDTFFVADLNESEIEGQRYYSINTNAYHVYNDQTRFFIPKVSNLYMLTSDEYIDEAKSILNYSHMMKDYNPDDYCLDAVLIYESDFDWKQVVLLKYYELFDNNKFNELIRNNGSMEIIEVEDEFTNKLLENVNSGEIADDYDVVELVKVYYN